jgi:hypothetical protein
MDKSKAIAEFGDFQTPLSLARECCDLLVQLDIAPSAIVEPTCGRGSFVQAAAEKFPFADQILGFDINSQYVDDSRSLAIGRVALAAADFFTLDWSSLIAALPNPILIIGNPPWVTNSELGTLNSENLPSKSNFHKMTGLDALTGKSNFDISEWMLMKLLESLGGRDGDLAVLCKAAVARKVLQHAWKQSIPVASAAIYQIDAARHFDASVEACFFVCRLGSQAEPKDCLVFDSVNRPKRIGAFGSRGGKLIADLDSHEQWQHLEGVGPYRWRSGVKHDCRKVMEFTREGNVFRNGYGEHVDLETDFLYPMLKSSEVANGRTSIPRRWMLVTQRSVGAETAMIRAVAPKTWDYLVAHGQSLDARASSIYKNRPRFSVFGVGDYTFSPWKVAISGFYKKFEFAKVGTVDGRPTVLDDTCYFVPCQSESEAELLKSLLNSEVARQFYSAYTFWDAKRPITVSTLSRLDITSLAHELGMENLLGGHQAIRRTSDRMLFQ